MSDLFLRTQRRLFLRNIPYVSQAIDEDRRQVNKKLWFDSIRAIADYFLLVALLPLNYIHWPRWRHNCGDSALSSGNVLGTELQNSTTIFFFEQNHKNKIELHIWNRYRDYPWNALRNYLMAFEIIHESNWTCVKLDGNSQLWYGACSKALDRFSACTYHWKRGNDVHFMKKTIM